MLSNKANSHKNYKQNYVLANLALAKKNAIFVILLFVFFAIFEHYFIKPLTKDSFNITAVILIVLTFLIGITSTDPFKKHWQTVMIFFIIIVGVGIIISSSKLTTPWNLLYLQGLLLLILYAYTISKLLLISAMVTGLSIVIAYLIYAIYFSGFSFQEISLNVAMLIFANILGAKNVSYNQKQLTDEFVLKQKDIERSQEINKLNKQLTKQSKSLNLLNSTDNLTGLANRKYFDEHIERSVLNSSNEETPLSLLFVDIDHFIHYNNYYGQINGDKCIQTIAKLLKETINNSKNVIARYGGKEFAIILPNTTYQKALKITTNVQSNFKKLRIEHKDINTYPYVTACYGLVTVSENYYSISTKKLLTYADTCLRKAQKDGSDNISGIFI